MTTISTNTDHDIADQPQAAPVAVQILSMFFFIGFAIVSTVLAFVWFWPAGFALAVLFGVRGFGPFHGGSRPMRLAARTGSREMVTPPTAPVIPSSGNASFDAYRSDMMARLEREHQSFQDFLVRLRDARDKTEFDTFMDDRARRVALISGTDPQGEDTAP